MLLIGAIAWAGAAVGLAGLFGVALPYVAVVVFIAGVVWRMVYWAKSACMLHAARKRKNVNCNWKKRKRRTKNEMDEGYCDSRFLCNRFSSDIY